MSVSEELSRLKNFKNNAKTTEDMRKRRTEVTVQLRKARKDEQFQKRRNIFSNMNNEDTLSKFTSNDIETNIDELKQDILSGDNNRKFVAVEKIRKLLSRVRNPPVEIVIKAGIVPLLIECLDDFQNVQLQFEAAWAITNIASGTSEQTSTIIHYGGVTKLINLLKSPHHFLVEQAVWALGNIAGDGPVPRDLILSQNVMFDLVKLITPQTPTNFLKNVIWTISNLCRNKNPPPKFELVAPCLPYFPSLLYHEDHSIISDCCWALSYLSDGSNNKIQQVIDQGVVPRLVQLLSSNNIEIITPSLRVIGNIVSGTNAQTDVVLRTDALQILKQLLHHPKNKIVKEATWTLSNVAAGNSIQIQTLLDHGILESLTHVLTKGDLRSQREAAWAITNFSNGCSISQLEALLKTGVIYPLCELLCSKDCKIVSIVLDGLSYMLSTMERFSDQNKVAFLIEQCGALNKIEDLQLHENDQIYQKAVALIDSYFSEDGMLADSSSTVMINEKNESNFNSNTHNNILM